MSARTHSVAQPQYQQQQGMHTGMPGVYGAQPGMGGMGAAAGMQQYGNPALQAQMQAWSQMYSNMYGYGQQQQQQPPK